MSYEREERKPGWSPQKLPQNAEARIIWRRDDRLTTKWHGRAGPWWAASSMCPMTSTIRRQKQNTVSRQKIGQTVLKKFCHLARCPNQVAPQNQWSKTYSNISSLSLFWLDWLPAKPHTLSLSPWYFLGSRKLALHRITTSQIAKVRSPETSFLRNALLAE